MPHSRIGSVPLFRSGFASTSIAHPFHSVLALRIRYIAHLHPVTSFRRFVWRHVILFLSVRPPSVCKSFFRFKRYTPAKRAHQSTHFTFIPLRCHFIGGSTSLFHVKHSPLFAISPLFATICPPKKTAFLLFAAFAPKKRSSSPISICYEVFPLVIRANQDQSTDNHKERNRRAGNPTKTNLSSLRFVVEGANRRKRKPTCVFRKKHVPNR